MGISPSLLRRYFLQEFARWLGTSILIVRCNEGGQVDYDYVESMTDNTNDVFAVKVAHYGDQPEHFNAICGPPSRRSICWQANNSDVLFAAIDVSPPLVEENESSEESASDNGEEDEAGEGGGG